MNEIPTYRSESKSQYRAQKRQQLVSFVVLCVFCIPGIMGEGLHVILPHRAPALIHHSDLVSSKMNSGTQDIPQNKKRRTNDGSLKFNPSCPVCQFCSLLKTKQVCYVVIDLTESVWTVPDVPFVSHESLLSHLYSGRSPPSFL